MEKVIVRPDAAGGNWLVPSKKYQIENLKLSGIIHVGANAGQEHRYYAAHRLWVLWIEPIPEIFRQLQVNISSHKRQMALNYFVGDEDDKPVTFHVSNNEGLSSSTMDLLSHKEAWPEVAFTRDIECRSFKLDTILSLEHINPTQYDGMVVDVQGSELKVLRGASSTLENMKMVQVESADFALYDGYPTPDEIGNFLAPYGLVERDRSVFWEGKGASCFDITYLKK